MRTVSIGNLVFRQPDDATAMRLLRSFFRASVAPDNTPAHVRFWSDFAELLLTPHDTALIARIRTSLGPAHPNCKMNPRAHWLALQLAGDIPALTAALATVIGVPQLFPPG